MDGANLGIPFGVRLRSIERTLATPLDDPDFIGLGVQIRGLRTMTAAIRDQLAEDRAADVGVFMEDVSDFAWTSTAYRRFVAEAERTDQLGDDGRAALIHVARTLEAQDEAIVAPELRMEIAAARINAQDDNEPEAEFALRRVLGNVLRAAARFARARFTGTAAHMWPTFDKELGERMGKTLSWIPIAGVSTLLLAQLLPAEFGAAGLLARLVKLLLD